MKEQDAGFDAEATISATRPTPSRGCGSGPPSRGMAGPTPPRPRLRALVFRTARSSMCACPVGCRVFPSSVRARPSTSTHVGGFVRQAFIDAFDDVDLNTARAGGDLGDQVGAFHAARLNRFGVTALRLSPPSRLGPEVMNLGRAAKDHQRPFDIADQDEEPAAPFLQRLGADEIPAFNPISVMRSATVLAYLSIPSTLCCRQRRCDGRGHDLVLKIAHAIPIQNDSPRKKLRWS
jgi:hypothetical protein